jgi:hypothetical protein
MQCQATNEEEIFEVQDKGSLLSLGWIHVSPALWFGCFFFCSSSERVICAPLDFKYLVLSFLLYFMIYTEGSRIMLAQVFPAQLSNQLTSTHTLWLEVEEGERAEHTNTAQHKSETLKECCSELLFIALA